MNHRLAPRFVASAALFLASLSPRFVRAGEGMWTFDHPPLAPLRDQFSFTPTPDWLDKVRLASVRFMDGGSGSFVSPDGLMITNQHVALYCLQNLSSSASDFIGRGFPAASRDEEKACPGYEVNVLVRTEDVTARVQAATKTVASDREAGLQRRRTIASVEQECSTKTGQRCEVIKLYGGGEFQLYQYKRYTDVRLVFAPEQGIAFFGGDPDNFTFPRHDLDVAFFRAYENGKPARPESYLKWGTAGANDGDLVFVSGSPGSTSRLDTTAQLESERDVVQPLRLRQLDGMLDALRAYAAQSPENDRRANDVMRTVENSQKARRGMLQALKDTAAMARKAAEERDLRAKVAAAPELAHLVGDPWAAIAQATAKLDARYGEWRVASYLGSTLLTRAGEVVLYATEVKKPNEERYPEYRTSALASLENELFAEEPVYKDLEEVQLQEKLRQAEAFLGREHPYVKAILGAETPAGVAHAALAGTKLDSAAARKALAKGGPAAVAASTDSLLVLARKIEPFYRAVRRFEEDEVEAVQVRAAEKLALARFEVYGRTTYPDATFTLRLSYGTVEGYPAQGTTVAPRTTFHGLYDRWASRGGKYPWNLPERWIERRERLDLTIPLNFVTSNDIIGGNSGSPVINRAGEFVGIAFDGNIESLAGDYYYDAALNRMVAVDARGIVEALCGIYDAQGLVKELLAQ